MDRATTNRLRVEMGLPPIQFTPPVEVVEAVSTSSTLPGRVNTPAWDPLISKDDAWDLREWFTQDAEATQ